MLNGILLNTSAGAVAIGAVMLASQFGSGPIGSGVYGPDQALASLRSGPDQPERNWTITTELADLMEMDSVLAPFLAARLDASHYTLDRVISGESRVPRLFLPRLPEDLKDVADTDTRKSIFLRTILPLVLQSNREILAERRRLLAARKLIDAGKALPVTDAIWLEKLADKYKTPADDLDRLVRRVDVVPVALALAQAVEESGWGSSRFARLGNAIFGQYTTLDDHGLIPKQAGDEPEFKIKAFPDLLTGIRSYMRNLNTHPAYAGLRRKRAEIRADGGKPLGRVLAVTLTGYSERGFDYVKTLHLIIDANDLSDLEKKARLAPPSAPAPVS